MPAGRTCDRLGCDRSWPWATSANRQMKRWNAGWQNLQLFMHATPAWLKCLKNHGRVDHIWPNTELFIMQPPMCHVCNQRTPVTKKISHMASSSTYGWRHICQNRRDGRSCEGLQLSFNEVLAPIWSRKEKNLQNKDQIFDVLEIISMRSLEPYKNNLLYSLGLLGPVEGYTELGFFSLRNWGSFKHFCQGEEPSK